MLLYSLFSPIRNQKKFYFQKIIGRAKNYLRENGLDWQKKIANLIRPFLHRRAEWGRIQVARILVVFCAGIVALTNIASKRSAQYAWLNLASENGDSVVMADSNYQSPEVFHSLSLAPIADASFNISPEEMQKLRQEGEKATVINQALVGVTNPTPEEFTSSEQDVFIYAVQEGDTLGSIAQKYNINSNTVLWANDLSNADMIHPGDQLFILPVSGVQYTVKSGDTIDSVAKRFKGQTGEIIAFNELPANGDLIEGQEIIIPDGTDPETATRRVAGAEPSGTAQAPSAPSAGTDRKFNKYYYSSNAHQFPWGWCTWYVASRRHVPWGGNAGTWLYHAKAFGANTGRAPKVGAIMVSGESRWGHVGVVESVSGGSFTISEMNYKGFGVVSKRTINTGAGFVRGFIY